MVSSLTLFIILVVLNILDVATTSKVLSQGGTELNPVVKPLMDAIGTVPALLLVKGLVLGIAYWQLALIPVPLLVVLIALYIYIVAHNYKQIK